MIRIRRVTLPPGLNAFVRRGDSGDFDVFVSDTLDPARARTAVRLALRSFRPAGPRTELLPLPVGLLVAGGIARIRSVVSVARAHAVLTAAISAATAVTAAAVIVIAAVPHQHGPATAGRLPVPPGRVHAAAPAHSPGLAAPGHARGAARSRRGRPSAGQSAVPTAARSPAAPQPSSAQPTTGPAPRPSSPAPQPAGSRSSAPISPTPVPTPSPSPTGGGGGVCIVLLGVWVCL